MVSANALTSLSLTLPTEGSTPALVRRSAEQQHIATRGRSGG